MSTGRVSGALTVDPVSGTVLVLSGPAVTTGPGDFFWTVELFLWANVGVEMVFEHRNAANTITLSSFVVPVVFGGISVPPWRELMGNGELLRVTARANVTGSVQATLLITVG